MKAALAFVALLVTWVFAQASGQQAPRAGSQPVEPYRVIANIYYVGSAIASGMDNSALNGAGWTPARVDRVLKDDEDVTLGGVTVTAHLTPGHTKGLRHGRPQ